MRDSILNDGFDSSKEDSFPLDPGCAGDVDYLTWRVSVVLMCFGVVAALVSSSKLLPCFHALEVETTSVFFFLFFDFALPLALLSV